MTKIVYCIENLETHVILEFDCQEAQIKHIKKIEEEDRLHGVDSFKHYLIYDHIKGV